MKTLTARQEEILKFIRNAILHRGTAPTLREIGQNFGITSVGAVGNHLSILVRKGFIKRGKYRARGISLVQAGTDREVSTMEPVGVPLVGQVAAGVPLLAEENIERYICLDQHFVRGRQVFCLKVRGESMKDAGIRDGDIVVVHKQPAAEPGDIVVALLDDGATVKFYQPNRNEIHLIPANETMYSIVVRDENFQIQGKVIGVYRELSK